jgi:hypothetical protein
VPLGEAGSFLRDELLRRIAYYDQEIRDFGPPEGLGEAAVVEPVDPGQRGELDLPRMTPGALTRRC